MKALILTIAAAATFSIPLLLQDSSSSKPRNLKVDVHYDKKKDLTTLRLKKMSLWITPLGSEWLTMSLAFEYPKRTIVKPKELLMTFEVQSKDAEPFPLNRVGALVDDVALDLGELDERIPPLSKDSDLLFEQRKMKISFDNFSQLAQAQKLTLIISDRKYAISERHHQILRDFLELMQREGTEIN